MNDCANGRLEVLPQPPPGSSKQGLWPSGQGERGGLRLASHGAEAQARLPRRESDLTHASGSCAPIPPQLSRNRDQNFGPLAIFCFYCCNWSGRWGSNPRHLAWEASVLPLNYARNDFSIARWGTRVQRSSPYNAALDHLVDHTALTRQDFAAFDHFAVRRFVRGGELVSGISRRESGQRQA
jgi:hypothetical protein